MNKLAVDQRYQRWLLLLLAGLIAIWVLFQEHGRLNDDAVIYLEAARQFALGEWKLGMNLYAWPLYPVLIAAVHQLTGLSLQHASSLLSVLFFVWATHVFMLLIKEAGGNQRVVIAGFLLLLSSTYIMRNVLPSVLREQGQWVFYLSSLLFFLRFYRMNRWRDALLWQICAIIAMLFRIESITYLILLPLVFISKQEAGTTQRGKLLLMSYSLTLAAVVGLGLSLLLTPGLKLSDIGRLHDPITVLQGAYAQITHGLIDKAHIIGNSVLGRFLSDYGMQGLLLTLAAIIVGKVSAASGWLALILSLYSHTANPQPNTDARKIMLWCVSLGLLNLWVILLCNFILPSRIAIPIAWLIMMLGAFTLSSLYDKWQHNRSISLPNNKLLYVVLAVLAIQLCITLKPRPAHFNDEQDAVAWIQQHVPANSKVFYDNPRFRYYANLPFVDRGIADWDRVTTAIHDGSINSYDYLVIHMDNRETDREKYLYQILPHHLVATINSSKNRRILIFALRDNLTK